MPAASRSRRVPASAAAVFFAFALALGSAAGRDRVSLLHPFVPGESCVYSIEIHTTTSGRVTTPINNSEGPTQASLTVNLRERLLVLAPVPGQAAGSVRLRVTWESARASSASDAADPALPDPAAPYSRLEGQSAEFTLGPHGSLTDFRGLEEIAPGGLPPADSVGWIASLVAASRFPRGGVSPGQRWSGQTPLPGAPLAGLFWRTQSVYQRNEPRSSAALPAGDCAVILSEMSIRRRGSAKSPATPPDYVRNGLQTVGTWSGTGTELASISLATGLLVAATATSTQSMDYTITSTKSGSAIHNQGSVETRIGITLLETALPAAPPGRAAPHR